MSADYPLRITDQLDYITNNFFCEHAYFISFIVICMFQLSIFILSQQILRGVDTNASNLHEYSKNVASRAPTILSLCLSLCMCACVCARLCVHAFALRLKCHNKCTKEAPPCHLLIIQRGGRESLKGIYKERIISVSVKQSEFRHVNVSY